MNNTAGRVLQAMRGMGLNPIEKNGEYRSDSPLRPGSNSNAFALRIEDGEHGAYLDHVSGESGSLYDLAKHLSVPVPVQVNGKEPGTIETTKRSYDGRADFARAHGATDEVFEKAGWLETTYQGRPALSFLTANGTRYRFLDGHKPYYINETGYSACFYGLARALTTVRDNQPLILCNGEASTVVAQHYGLSAFAKTAGEARLPDLLLTQLKEQWGKHVIIALDCDSTGGRAAKEIQEQYPDSTIIDLGLGEHGDLADFCNLFQADVQSRLDSLIAKAQQPPGVSSKRLARDYIKSVGKPDSSPGRAFRFPFPSFHAFGGLASTLLPGKIVGISAPSGGGKTAFVETVVDHLAKAGFDSLFYGPEWSEKEIHLRRLARMGGTLLDISAQDLLWHQEAKDGIPKEWRTGRQLTAGELQLNCALSAQVGRWPGEVYCYPHTRYIEDTLDSMIRAICRLRLQGRKPVVAVFDYTSLLRSSDRDDSTNRHEMVTEKIKEFTQLTQIVAFGVAQIRKDASSAQRQGRTIDAEDALYLRSDKFNLFISLNRNHVEDPVTKETIILNTGYGQITKNSGGRTGKVSLIPQLDRHTWIDPKDRATAPRSTTSG